VSVRAAQLTPVAPPNVVSFEEPGAKVVTSSLVVVPEVHPEVDLPELRALLHPERELWSAGQLRTLTRQVSAELTTALLVSARYRSDRRWWARLALTDGVELWLLSWLPGQATRPHDHGGASGSFTVVRGTLSETFRYPGAPFSAASGRWGRPWPSARAGRTSSRTPAPKRR
jgi:hypothetical protein